MAWTKQEEAWHENPVDELREHTSFAERGRKLITLWCQHIMADFELKLHVGYALDPKTHKRTHAIIGVSFNGSKPIEFSRAELQGMIDFFRQHGNQLDYRGHNEFERGYKEDLDGFLLSLECGLEQAKQFEPNNLN